MPATRTDALLAFRQCGYPEPSDVLLEHIAWALDWAHAHPLAAWRREIAWEWSKAWSARTVDNATDLMIASGLTRVEMQGVKMSETAYATPEQFMGQVLGVLLLPVVVYAHYEHHGVLDEPLMIKHTRAATRAIGEGKRSTLTAQCLKARTDLP